MWRDLQYGLRQVRRNKLFSAIVIVLLAIGIGANTLVFSLVNELLLKPLPVRNPQNLYLLERIFPDDIRPGGFFQFLILRDVIQKSSLFSAAVAEQEWTDAQILPMSTGEAIRLVMAQIVSPNYFTELGVEAAAGRVLTEADAADSSTLPAVLSYQFWQSQFGGSRDVIGRTIRLKGVPFVVVGVLPRAFHSSDIDRAPDVRLPISAAPALVGHAITDAREPTISFRILVRLKSGVSAAGASERVFGPLTSTEDWLLRARNVYRQNPMSPADLDRAARDPGYRLRLEPVGRGISQLRDQFSQALRLLLGGVVLLLLAVCANVAGLLMAKAGQRAREIGIRVAVGAGRAQLIRQLLIENLLLALPGALLGAWLAFAISPWLVALLPPPRDYGQLRSPQILAVIPDARVLLFAVSLTAACVLAFGLVPAWRCTGAARTWGRSCGTSWRLVRPAQRRGHRTIAATAPIALQVGFCVVLLSAAALMLRTFWNLDRLDTGFDRAHIVEFTVDPVDAGYTRAQSGSFYRELKDRVELLPGVRSVAFASRGVMRSVGFKTTVAPQGVVFPASTSMNASQNEVTPEYFETMGLPILAGRGLSRGDVGRKPSPVVVNQAFADFFFIHQNPVGKLLVLGTDGNQPPAREIVGLTVNAKYRSMREPDPPCIYIAMDESRGSDRPILMHVRTHGGPAAIIPAVRQAIAGLDSRLPLVEVLTMEQEIRTSLWQERLVALLSAFFGVVSILLAGIGLYGSLSWAVARRTRELGIRVAVGAQARHIVQTVCLPIAMAVMCGLAAGILAASFLLGLTGHLLFGVEPLDPRSFAAAACFVILCAVAAALLPAWRAVRIGPSSALREE